MPTSIDLDRRSPCAPIFSPSIRADAPTFQYPIFIVIVGVLLYSCYAALAAFLLPNPTNGVGAATVTATSAQEHLLESLKQYEAAGAAFTIGLCHCADADPRPPSPNTV